MREITQEEITERLKEIAFLISRGVPYDVIKEFDDFQRREMVIAFGEIEGGDFDRDKMKWRVKSRHRYDMFLDVRS